MAYFTHALSGSPRIVPLYLFSLSFFFVILYLSLLAIEKLLLQSKSLHLAILKLIGKYIPQDHAADQDCQTEMLHFQCLSV